ncbi:hypothetical protein HS125_04825 [bacterium]|nr:hypothetical protein [bacterium]
MELKRRERVLAVLAIAVLAIWAADQLLIEPLWGLWKARQERLSELSASILHGRSLVDRAAAISERWQEMRGRSLPADEPAAEQAVLVAVSRWAGTSRLGVSALKPRWREDEGGRRQIEWNAEAQGDIAQIARFLYELERDSLALRVEELDITARDNRGETLALKLRFTGLVFEEKTS